MQCKKQISKAQSLFEEKSKSNTFGMIKPKTFSFSEFLIVDLFLSKYQFENNVKNHIFFLLFISTFFLPLILKYELKCSAIIIDY